MHVIFSGQNDRWPYPHKNSAAIFYAILLALKISSSLPLEVNIDHERRTSIGLRALPRS